MSEGLGKIKGLERKDVAALPTERFREAPLSPEVVEKIMEKVRDIDTEGLAYSRIPTEVTKNILQEGLLGADFRKSGGGSVGHEGTTKESWAKVARGHRAISHFNIVGREWGPHRKEKQEVYGSSIGGSYYSAPGAVFIVFNLSKFEEVEVETSLRDGSGPPNISHKFESNSYISARERYDTEVGRIVDDEHGFLLSSRVAPRFFQGIVFCPERKFDAEFIDKLHDHIDIHTSEASAKSIREKIHSFERQIDEYKAKEQVVDLVRLQMETDTGSPELLNPIYDTEGNLWWPKQMSHEEVKKFSAERDTRESEEVVT